MGVDRPLRQARESSRQAAAQVAMSSPGAADGPSWLSAPPAPEAEPRHPHLTVGRGCEPGVTSQRARGHCAVRAASARRQMRRLCP